jgi:hypothetical protein
MTNNILNRSRTWYKIGIMQTRPNPTGVQSCARSGSHFVPPDFSVQFHCIPAGLAVLHHIHSPGAPCNRPGMALRAGIEFRATNPTDPHPPPWLGSVRCIHPGTGAQRSIPAMIRE